MIAGLQNWKTVRTRTMSKEFHDCGAGRKLLCVKKALEGFLRNWTE
jgi:hypothetical protein